MFLTFASLGGENSVVPIPDINTKAYVDYLVDNSIASFSTSINANDYAGATDSETIENTIAAALVIGKCKIVIDYNVRTSSTDWLLDRAILMHSNLIIEVDGVRLKLNNNVFDNVVRNAGITYGTLGTAPNPPGSISSNHDIHLLGINGASIEGATTLLHPYGDEWGWRQIGVLFGYCNTFSMDGFTVKDTHAWGVTMEYLSHHGRINNLIFDQNEKNGDGVDVRSSCNNIVINNISGYTKDDSVAVTGILKTSNEYSMEISGGGSLNGGGETASSIDYISYIFVDDITSDSATHLMITLSVSRIKISNIYVNNLTGETPYQIYSIRNWTTTIPYVAGDTSNVYATNITATNTAVPLRIENVIKDSTFDNTNGSVPNEIKTGQDNVVITNDHNGQIDI